MRVEFPSITIGGIAKRAYSIDLSGGGSSPTSMRLSFITSGESYTPNTLNEIDISIGSFYTFTGYIVSVSTRESASGNITELSLIDTSIKLDKIFVGLKGKHGPHQAPLVNSSNIKTQRNATVDLLKLSPTVLSEVASKKLNNLSVFEFYPQTFPLENLILIGDAIDPCKDIAEDDTDPCDPCSAADSTFAEKLMDCSRARSFQILDVDYSFNDLINALSARGFVFNNRFSGPVNYRAQYTGTAREVLSNWCKDFGYAFYWRNNSIYFVNLAMGIAINDTALSTNCVIEDKTTTLSIENNFKRINIAYFGKAGEIKEYDCSKGNTGDNNSIQPVSMDAISLSLLMEGNSDLLGNAVYKSTTHFRSIVAAGNYSKDLRDLYCWTKIYGYESPTSVRVGKHSLMGWDVKAVCYATPTESQITSEYNPQACVSLYEDILKSDAIRGSFYTAENIQKLRAAGAYFVIVEDFGTKAFDFEEGVREAFCGKYWVHSTNTTNAEPVHPDGNVRILKGVYGNTEYVLPDLNISHQYIKSSSAKIFSRFTNPRLSDTKVVILERPAYWGPDANDPTVTDFLETLNQCKIEEINYSASYAGLKDNHKIFLIYSFDGTSPQFETSLTDQGKIPTERAISSKLGIRTNATYRVKFDLAVPGATQSRVAYLKVDMPTEASYHIQLIPNKSSYSIGPFRTIIPKFEAVITEENNIPSDNCVGVEVNYQNVTDGALAKLNYQDGKCFIDKDRVFPYVQGIINDLSNNAPFIKKTVDYTVLGIPSVSFTMEDGLMNFSVKMDSSGTRTNLSFSNSVPENSSENVKRHEFNYFIKNQAVKTYINNTV